MKERTIKTAKEFSILDRVEKLERELLSIDGVTKVDFDLDGFYDDIHYVIFLTKYDIPVTLENYFETRQQMVKNILEVANNNGLKRTGDRIEDYGEWFYFVTSCGSRWK